MTAPRPLVVAAATVALLSVAPMRALVAADPPWVQAEASTMTPLGMTAGELQGARLYGEDGEVLGVIDEVLVAPEGGAVAGLSVDVGTGALGIGEPEVLLRFDQVRREGNRITTRLSRALLEAQPRWND